MTAIYPGTKDTIPMVRCAYHPDEYVTNYDCILLQPICPECLDAHLKSNQANGVPPEVDTLKKVRNMCSSKALSLAKSLESELAKIGFALPGNASSLMSKMMADLENARRKLHKFIDDYVDSVKADVIKRVKGEGDNDSLNKLLQEIKHMINELRINEKQLYSTHILSSIKKIISIDQEDYIREIKAKLGLLAGEHSCVDLELNEAEMLELLAILQRILTLNKKTKNNFDTLEDLKGKIEPSIEPSLANYFHRKFGAQENKMNLEKAMTQISAIKGPGAASNFHDNTNCRFI